MKLFDSLFEDSARQVARRTSRRSFLSRMGTALTGTAAIPLLPVARGAEPAKAQGQSASSGDPNSCDYWRYCAIDGFLCGCCGGSIHECPPGTEPSPITWIGTCRNPDDGKDYIVSYNDCCGKSACGRCFCNRNEGDLPLYVPFQSNDYNWCVGSRADLPYNCSLSRIVGLAK